MIMTKTRLIKYLINQLELYAKYSIIYDSDKGEWIIRPLE